MQVVQIIIGVILRGQNSAYFPGQINSQVNKKGYPNVKNNRLKHSRLFFKW
ncbi:hypothetical protein ES708_22686 [subsurface metagenome]